MPKSAAKPKISEAHVQRAVVDILQADGWRAIRTHPQPPVVQRLDAIMAKAPEALQICWRSIRGWVLRHTHKESFGEEGMPDYLFIRYLNGAELEYPGGRMVLKRPAAEVLWAEFKRKNGVPRAHQVAWHSNENARGAMVRTVDSVDDFRDWYKASGLMRHEILT
jgi:hypothetical protein